jgi:hypothetical protein
MFDGPLFANDVPCGKGPPVFVGSDIRGCPIPGVPDPKGRSIA